MAKKPTKKETLPAESPETKKLYKRTAMLLGKVYKGIARTIGGNPETAMQRARTSAVELHLEHKALIAHLIKTGVIDKAEYEETYQQVLEKWIRDKEMELSTRSKALVTL